MQDQAFLGPESGLAVPDGTAASTSTSRPSGCTSTSARSARRSGSRRTRSGCQLAGVGGAFGGREDLSMHVHGCLLALHTGKPVKMVYNREESFFGHVHRHPAKHALRARRRPRRHAGLRPRHDLPRRRRLRVQHPCRRRQRGHDGPRPLRRSRTSTWTATAPTRTTRRAARCAASAPCRRRSRSRRRWTSSPTRSAWTRSSCASATAMHEGSPRTDRPGHRQRRAGRGAGPTGCAAMPLPRHLDAAPTCGRCPAASPTRPTARAYAAASATRSPTRTSPSPRASTTTRPPGCGSRSSAARPVRHRAHRGRRGRPGTGHRRAADLPHRARRRHGRGRAPRTPRSAPAGRPRRRARPTSPAARSRPPARACARLVLARAAQHGWSAGSTGSGSRTASGQPRAGAVLDLARRPARRRRRRGDRRVAAPADVADRPGDRARASPTCSTRSPRTARSSTSTSSSGWSRWSSSPAPRTSARR